MQFDFSVNLTTINKLAELYPEASARVIRRTLGVIAARLEKSLVEKTPRGISAQGGLAGSMHGEVVPYGRGFAAIAGTPLEYGVVIDQGRRPGQKFPPIAPIALWAVRKLGVEKKDASRVAFLIARKIAIKGFPGVRMFEKTLQELQGWIMDELSKIHAEIIAEVNGGAV